MNSIRKAFSDENAVEAGLFSYNSTGAVRAVVVLEQLN